MFKDTAPFPITASFSQPGCLPDWIEEFSDVEELLDALNSQFPDLTSDELVDLLENGFVWLDEPYHSKGILSVSWWEWVSPTPPQAAAELAALAVNRVWNITKPPGWPWAIADGDEVAVGLGFGGDGGYDTFSPSNLLVEAGIAR